jgi:hypothetical protein
MTETELLWSSYVCPCDFVLSLLSFCFFVSFVCFLSPSPLPDKSQAGNSHRWSKAHGTARHGVEARRRRTKMWGRHWGPPPRHELYSILFKGSSGCAKKEILLPSNQSIKRDETTPTPCGSEFKCKLTNFTN